MNKRPPKAKSHFKVLAAFIIILAATILALLLPTIGKLKSQIVDSLIEKSKQARKEQDFRLQRGLLEQANLIGIVDSRPLVELADYYQNINRYDLAYATYQRLVRKDYLKLAQLALKAQNYSASEDNFLKASQKNPGGESLSGLAIAQFNLGKINEGCHNSQRATHLNLNDSRAAIAKQVCEILSSEDKNRLSRKIAYFLIQNQVVVPGEKALRSSQDKTASDYLVLAQIAASRGEYQTAIKLLKEGLKIDKTHLQLNKTLARYLEITGNQKELKTEQKVLDNLILNDN